MRHPGPRAQAQSVEVTVSGLFYSWRSEAHRLWLAEVRSGSPAMEGLDGRAPLDAATLTATGARWCGGGRASLSRSPRPGCGWDRWRSRPRTRHFCCPCAASRICRKVWPLLFTERCWMSPGSAPRPLRGKGIGAQRGVTMEDVEVTAPRERRSRSLLSPGVMFTIYEAPAPSANIFSGGIST